MLCVRCEYHHRDEHPHVTANMGMSHAKTTTPESAIT
jgi:hypothetical protein